MKHLLLLNILILQLASCATSSNTQTNNDQDRQKNLSPTPVGPSGMVVKSNSEPAVEMKQKKCPQGLDKAPHSKTKPQIAVGLEKKIGSKDGPTAYTEYEECLE